MHGSMRRGLETEQTWPRSLGWRNRPGNRRHMKAPGPTVSEPPRQPPTLQGCSGPVTDCASARFRVWCMFGWRDWSCGGARGARVRTGSDRRRMVAEINGVAKAELDPHRHLFGSDRLTPPRPLREGIAALQADRCFCCQGSLGARPGADHFSPRVRCGVAAVENLVLADRVCNNDKGDLLLAPLSWPPGYAATTATPAGSRSSPMPAGGIPTRMPPWPLHARSMATCPRAVRRSGSGSGTSERETRPRFWPC